MQQTETDERWYVQFDSGEVRLMTLEELDGAFEAGEVHENTFVIQVGETKWQTLADVAGLNDEESEEPEAPEAEAEPETTTLYTPHQAAALHASAQYAAPRQPAAAPYAAPQQPTAQRPAFQQPAAQQYTGQHAPAQQRPAAVSPSARPAVAAAAGGWPPVAAPAAQQSSWPPAAFSPQGGGYNIGPQSTIPVVNDLGLDFDARSFKSGRKTALLAAFAVIPALAGGGYMLTRLDMPGEATAAAAPAASPPAPKSSPWSGSLGASMPTPTPAATPPAEAKTESAASGSLSDDMKKALLASDSSRTPKSKAKAAAPARRASGNGGTSKGSSVFKAGGSTNDPLNSKL